ncbi:MAG: hypothetical protein WA581_00465, partial [Candidatus Acidiferrales bacterium]
MDVSREPIEARYHEFGFEFRARGERSSELRSVGSLAAFNLNELGREFPVLCCCRRARGEGNISQNQDGWQRA